MDRYPDYSRWLSNLDQQNADSREEFIVHHRNSRDGVNAAQLKSWLRALNVARNVCAHHGRFFNRYYSLTHSLTPKLPHPGSSDSLDAIANQKDTTFAMITLLQLISSFSIGSNQRILPAALHSFPSHNRMRTGVTGAPDAWESLSLWRP